MCGLVGMFGGLSFKSPDIMKQMLIIDSLRGPHSTGLAVIKDNKNPPILLKETGPPCFLLSRKETNEATASTTTTMGYIGHNRFATRGAVTDENAHPFTHGNITLAHNGTVTSVFKLMDLCDVKPQTPFDTDSEALCYAISQVGIDAVWKNLEGAAAIVYWDNDDQSLNFVTNGERPLHFIVSSNKHTKSIDMVYWASEIWMAEAAIARNLTEHQLNLIDLTTYSAKKNFLITLRKTGVSSVEYTMRELQEYKRPPVYGIRGGGRIYRDGVWIPIDESEDFLAHRSSSSTRIPSNHPVMSRRERRKLEKMSVAERRKKEKDDRDAMVRLYKPWLDKGYSIAQFVMSEFRFKQQYIVCSFCHKDVRAEGEFEEAILTGPDTCICGDCAVYYADIANSLDKEGNEVK